MVTLDPPDKPNFSGERPGLYGTRRARTYKGGRSREGIQRTHIFEITLSAYFSRLRILFSSGSVSGPMM